MTDAAALRRIVADECPGLAQDCVDGTAGAERYRRTAAEFAARRYPGCPLAFVYGSAARGDPTFFSDIDLYIVAETGPGLCLIEVFDGLPVQARVEGRPEIESLFRQPPGHKRTLFLAQALVAALRVAGSAELLEELGGRARAWLERCPADPGLDLLAAHRLRITNRVLDLARGRGCRFRHLRDVFEVADSIRALGNAERSVPQADNLLAHLAARWPERADRLSRAIAEATERDDVTALVRLAIEATEPFGGFLMDRVHSRQPLEP